MIRYNIILWYVIYIITILIFSIIDMSIILYYIFWFLNVFIYPFFWLTLKIIFYNRTILLLLLFYYILAKNTIDIGGYKYFYFFGIDVGKYHSKYYDYIWSITSYHIEMISIFLFFIVIIGPLFFFNKEIILLFSFLIILFIILRKLFKLRLKNYKNGNTLYKSMGEIIIFFIFLFVIFNIMKYSHIKNVFTLYFHFDIWVFNLLEWKIEMSQKSARKDIYTTLLGLQPQWYSLKENMKEKSNEKKWDKHFSQNNKLLIYNKWKIGLDKNYYYKKVELFKYKKYNKLKDTKKLLFNKCMKFKYEKKPIAYKNDLTTWQYPVNIPNENPVVTKEKSFERNVHKSLILRRSFVYSTHNYYDVNDMLRKFTIKKDVYQEPFLIEKTDKQLNDELKKKNLYVNASESLVLSGASDIFDKILEKIERNSQYIKKLKGKITSKNEGFFFKKMIKYIIIKKSYNNYFDFVQYDTKSLLIGLDNRLTKYKEYMKLDITKKYTSLILNKENKFKLKTKYNNNDLLNFSKYVEREQLEKIDNKLLLDTLNKYEDEKSISNSKSKKDESSMFVYKKEKKHDLITELDQKPDLSRRNND